MRLRVVYGEHGSLNVDMELQMRYLVRLDGVPVRGQMGILARLPHGARSRSAKGQTEPRMARGQV